ncbi:MAG: GNAT family N-acetyltransferase [Chloroflexota bacterium]|nr:MAG: GNAT family N-acetyltransferase [Chloroflexota bacterium]
MRTDNDFPLPLDGVRYREHLDAAELKAIGALAARCRRADGIDHPLHDEPECSAILQYAAGELIGVATLQHGAPIEACILVDPKMRRRDIGRRLYAAVLLECQQRGSGLLLTVNDQSASGREFAAAVGAGYEFSEYRMELVEAPRQSTWPVNIDIRDVGVADAATFAEISAAAFGEPRAVTRIEAGIRAGRHRYYLGLLDGAAIACIRVNMDDGPIYVTSFAVRPEHQGRGYGRQILTRVVRTLASEDRPIMIEVATNNQNALHLYRSCGFQIRVAFAYYRARP